MLFSFSRQVVNLVQVLQLGKVIDFVVNLLPGGMRKGMTRLRASIYVSLYGHRQPALVPVESLKSKQREAWQYLRDRFGAEALWDYLEFGVYTGTSLGCMYENLQDLGLRQVRLFGFDSFEGLPATAAAEDEGAWGPGQFRVRYEYTQEILRRKGIDWQRVFLVKGWFSDTLTPELIHQHQIKKASVIMVDCDIYSAAKEALMFCEPLIQDRAVIFFDDWKTSHLDQRNLGEKRAFDEFLQEKPFFTVEEFGDYGGNSIAFVVIRKP